MPRSGKASSLAKQVAPLVAQYVGLRAPAEQATPDGAGFDAERFLSSELGAFWVGHATMLLRMRAGDSSGDRGVTLLTDPHFEDHAVPSVAGRPAGRRRSVALPMGVGDLPPVDVVLLSHAHMDHWEKRSLERLAGSGTAVVIPPRTRRLLPAGGRSFGEVVEARWGETVEAGGVRVTAIKPRHWGARYLVDVWRGYNAYLVESAGRRVLFGGDTGHTHAFDEVGGVDLAALGIGNSYEPWGTRHASPEQAAAMAERMGARLVAPIHHATFHDPSEGRDEPLERFLAAWPMERTVCARIGELYCEG